MLRILLCVFFISIVRADPYQGDFTNPKKDQSGVRNNSNNAIWRIGSSETISWRFVEDYPEYTIYLFQEQYKTQKGGVQGPDVFEKKKTELTVGSFEWVVSPLRFDISDSEVFFFWLVQGQEQFNKSFISEYFNLTSETASSSTSRPSTTSTFASASAFSESTTASSPSSALTSEQPGSSTISNHKLQLGLGIGLGLGGGIMALLAILWVLRRLKRAGRTNESGANVVEATDMSKKQEMSNYKDIHDLPEYVAPAELPSPSPHALHELQ